MITFYTGLTRAPALLGCHGHTEINSLLGRYIAIYKHHVEVVVSVVNNLFFCRNLVCPERQM